MWEYLVLHRVAKIADCQDTCADSRVEKEGFLMYGKTQAKKWSTPLKKWSTPTHRFRPSNDGYITLLKKVTFDSVVKFYPHKLNSCHDGQILTLCGSWKRRKEKERKRKKKKEKRRFSQRWMWRINISFFTTFGVFCWLDLKFKGCFVFKYFSPRRNYVLNIPNCSISHDFFWGSRTFSFYGSLVVKILNFLWPLEFWELPKGCHSLLE